MQVTSGRPPAQNMDGLLSTSPALWNDRPVFHSVLHLESILLKYPHTGNVAYICGGLDQSRVHARHRPLINQCAYDGGHDAAAVVRGR